MYKDIQIDVNNIDTNLTVLHETDNSITVNEATGSKNNSVTDDCVEDTEDSIPVNQEKSSFQNQINDLNDSNDNNEEKRPFKWAYNANQSNMLAIHYP